MNMTGAEVTALPVLPPRSTEANKGTFGRVLVVAGSRGMSGAAVLCASAALRGGAGLVRVAIPESILPLVASGNPCYMTSPLEEDGAGRLASSAADELIGLAEGFTVLAVGPGLGRSAGLTHLVSEILRRVRVPVVLDADGLNVLDGHVDRLAGRSAPLVITPHPGEFARLTGLDVPALQAGRQDMAVRFASEHGLVVLLKGHGTVVTDGRRVYVNPTGTPAMATAGSGDVLTGLVAALLAQGLEAFAAAQLAAWIHGWAGQLAHAELGGPCLIATDLLQYLPRAFPSA